MGASGAGFVSLVGTTSNDLTSSLFVLGALLGVLKTAGPGNEGGARLGFAASGLLAGLGIGLKYTSAIYIPGLGAVALLAAVRRRALGGVVVFGLGALLGFLVVAGHQMLGLLSSNPDMYRLQPQEIPAALPNQTRPRRQGPCAARPQEGRRR